MAWFYLFSAIGFELIGTMALKFSNGLNKKTPTIIMLASYACCFPLLALALKHMPLSIAYAIWAGAGTIGIVLLGKVFFNEKLNPLKLFSLLLILLGLLLLKGNLLGFFAR